MAALFQNASLLENDDLVGFDNRGEAVGNDQHGLVPHVLLERFLDDLLRAGVQGARRLIKDQNVRISENRTRKRKPLALAAG